MTAFWEPGTAYGPGDIVRYEGHRYKIIIPHTSQGDWNPTVTPNLWGRLSDEDKGEWDGYQEHHKQPADYKPPVDYHPPAPEEQKVDIPHEERQKRWYDLDDNRKKDLEIGGGLLAGIAAAAGGYYLYKHHEKSEEDKKSDTWALQNWLHDAEARQKEYRQNGPRGPAQWILNKGKDIPPNAIVVGPEHDWTLWICRAYIDGTIQVGKASNVFERGAVIGYHDKEVQLDTYEILVGDMRGLKWVDASGYLDVDNLRARPVEGGHDKDGTPLFIAEAPHNGAVHPGIASAKLEGAVIPYGGKTVQVNNYRVLCYNF
ncbi:carbohydrate-binding module family 12 protein [Rhodocollybia butyracea]|uniref:Carbohydrate-binding module family 12 protein n=1 Tax=Rhodocollybia butyracea TaxID=206335 RepID=A0A9P5PYW6_9AGAR|nr:carbohydrate-binding module family 12 protein [Rhodocollybia butyracea]